MAKGSFRQWATARIKDSISLGKSGIQIVVWNKGGKTRRGTLVVSVGGVRWFRHNAKTPTRTFRWSELDAET